MDFVPPVDAGDLKQGEVWVQNFKTTCYMYFNWALLLP